MYFFASFFAFRQLALHTAWCLLFNNPCKCRQNQKLLDLKCKLGWASNPHHVGVGWKLKSDFIICEFRPAKVSVHNLRMSCWSELRGTGWPVGLYFSNFVTCISLILYHVFLRYCCMYFLIMKHVFLWFIICEYAAGRN